MLAYFHIRAEDVSATSRPRASSAYFAIEPFKDVVSPDVTPVFMGEPQVGQYQKLKKKYAEPISKPKKGIYCKVEFFETHRCTELFFLYYFRYTSRPYENQEQLLNDLNQCVVYKKANEFFRKGLHSYFERNNGRLAEAIANAERSMAEKQRDGREYTYSDLGRLITLLKELK